VCFLRRSNGDDDTFVLVLQSYYPSLATDFPVAGFESHAASFNLVAVVFSFDGSQE
jgi:hypothetical protein